MEDGEGSSAAAESLQRQAAEGARFLDSTVEAAHEILGSLDEVLGNPLLWAQSPPSPGPGGAAAAAAAAPQEQGWVALDTGRVRYKSTSAALRTSIAAIFEHPRMRASSEGDAAGEKGQAAAAADAVAQLEMRARLLKDEVVRKNQILKRVIDQSREIVSDISIWQNGEL